MKIKKLAFSLFAVLSLSALANTDRLDDLEAFIYGYSSIISGYGIRFDSVEDKIKTIEKNYTNFNKELNELKGYKGISEAYDDTHDSIIHGYETRFNSVDAKIDTIKNKYTDSIADISKNLGNFNKELNKLKEYKVLQETFNHQYNSIISGYGIRFDSVDAKIETIEKNYTDLYKSITSRDEEINNITDSIAKHETLIGDIKKEIKETNALNNAKFSNLESGVAMVAAMDAASFSALSEGELEIAGGVATYAGKQAVAVGIAYAPSDVFNVNTKVGVNFGSKINGAASAGARYKFSLK